MGPNFSMGVVLAPRWRGGGNMPMIMTEIVVNKTSYVSVDAKITSEGNRVGGGIGPPYLH